MNKYSMTLIFPEISESIPVTIMASSSEEAMDCICAGKGTKRQVEAGNPDRNSEAVSVIYIETIRISVDEITNIYMRLFTCGNFEGNISKTVRFPNRMEMDISACKDLGAPGWTEAALFCSGNECGHTDTREKLEGIWALCRNGIMYVTVVVPETNLWAAPNIIILPGSCLDSAAQVVAHQTNCRGVMGAGVALAIREKYPEIMPEYQEACLSRNMLGQCQLIATEDERYIANLFGQDRFGSGTQTDYEALQSAFNSLADLMQTHRLTSLSMPYKLGCGLAGGDWNIVFKMLKKAFTGKHLRLELWRSNEQNNTIR